MWMCSNNSGGVHNTGCVCVCGCGCEDVSLENGEEKTVVTCTIGNVYVIFDEIDIDKALGLLENDFEDLANDDTLIEFMDFINYTSTIDLDRLNKKYVRRE